MLEREKTISSNQWSISQYIGKQLQKLYVFTRENKKGRKEHGENRTSWG